MDEEDESWAHIIKQCKPLPVQKQRRIMKKPVTVLLPPLQPRAHRAMPAHGPLIDLEIPINAPLGLSVRQFKALKRGKYPVDATLDLHGHTLLSAQERLESFLIHSYHVHHKVVCVITGKGKLQPDFTRQGVIREALPKWLHLPSLRMLVHTYCKAHQADGGEGAFYIILRK